MTWFIIAKIKHMNLKKKLLIFVLILTASIHYSQTTDYSEITDFTTYNEVRWIGQIPTISPEEKVSKKGWLKRLIFGKDDLTSLQKPVMAVPLKNAKTFILDQGAGTVFVINENNLEVPRIFKKQQILFPSLISACQFYNNKLLMTDSGANKIYEISEDFKQFNEFNISLDLKQPTGIAFSKSNNEVWVVETGKHRIAILDSKGNIIKTIGQRGFNPGEFNYPTSIWIDNQGIAYVVDALNYRIQLFDKNGNFISMFGENGNGTGYFASPKGIATDSRGNIYVADALFHTVQIFDNKGNFLYNFGTQGRDPGNFWMPSGIFINENDVVYVTDSYNNRIQLFEIIYVK